MVDQYIHVGDIFQEYRDCHKSKYYLVWRVVGFKVYVLKYSQDPRGTVTSKPDWNILFVKSFYEFKRLGKVSDLYVQKLIQESGIDVMRETYSYLDGKYELQFVVETVNKFSNKSRTRCFEGSCTNKTFWEEIKKITSLMEIDNLEYLKITPGNYKTKDEMQILFGLQTLTIFEQSYYTICKILCDESSNVISCEVFSRNNEQDLYNVIVQEMKDQLQKDSQFDCQFSTLNERSRIVLMRAARDVGGSWG